MRYVKRDEIFVYLGTLETIELRTISLIAMDIRIAMLANATQKKKRKNEKQWRKCCPPLKWTLNTSACVNDTAKQKVWTEAAPKGKAKPAERSRAVCREACDGLKGQG